MVDDAKHQSRRNVLKAMGGSALALGAAGHAIAKPDGLVEINVGYASASGKAAALDAAADVVREFNFDAVTIRASGQAAEALGNRPDVRYVEENGQMHAFHHRDGHDGGPGDDDDDDGGDDGSNQVLPWGVDRVDAEVAHANGDTGSGADVAIIDTGIDSDHPDLQANLGEGTAFVSCRGGGCNYDWDDDNDHGTHCAGIAGAVDDDDGVVGVAPGVTLHAVKVLDGSGSGSFSDVAAGIEWTADQGYDVGSLSLGASSGSDVVKDACEYADGKGVLLVAAAGNDGPCSDCVGYPAAYSEVLAVSSTNDGDDLSSYSSTGPEVELAAPGEDVYSTVVGGYDTFSGTSMACPHVSGAAGLLMANGASNDNARSTLKNNAEDIGLGSNEQGAGLLDAAAALGHDSSDDL